MAIVTTTATFNPTMQTWQQPMLRDNTPEFRAAPIARVNWFSSVVIPAKAGGDDSELVVTLNTFTNFALRFRDISWEVQSVNTNDTNELNDLALFTVPDELHTRNYILTKGEAENVNLTNVEANQMFTAPTTPGGSFQSWNIPFIATTPMVFKVANENTGGSALALGIVSNVTADVFTIEQYNQGYIWA